MDESRRASTCVESSHSKEANDFVRLSNVSGHDFERGRVKIISWEAKKVVDGLTAQYIADRDLFKLTYFWKEYPELDYYRGSILKVGASLILTATPNDFVENIESLDAEWHRGQSWALENEYVGNEVRVIIDGEERNGVVWGWLPAGDSCNFENHNRWKIRFVGCVPMILDESLPGLGSAPLGEQLRSETLKEATAGACAQGPERVLAASSSLQLDHKELRKLGMAGVVGQLLTQGEYKPVRPLVTDSSVSRIPVR